MKIVSMVLCLILIAGVGWSSEKVWIEVEMLQKIRDQLVELRTLAEKLNAELDVKTMELAKAKAETEKYRKAARGLWIGAGSGMPWPSVAGIVWYQAGDRVGVWSSGGWNGNGFINLGFSARITK